MNNNIPNDLNTRQWILYEYLKKRNSWTKLKDIQKDLNYKEYRLLKTDIRAIKESERIKKVLLSSTVKGVKFAAKDEYKTFADKRWAAIVRMIQLQKKLDKKAGMNGQYRLVFGKESDYIEVYE